MLLLPAQLHRCCRGPLLLHIHMQHLHSAAVNNIPECQVLCVVLPNVFALLLLLLLFFASFRHVQQQLLLIGWQLEQPTTQ